MFWSAAIAIVASLISTSHAIGNDFGRQVRLNCLAMTTREYSELVRFANKLQVDIWEEIPRAFPAVLTMRVYMAQVAQFQSHFPCPSVSPLPAVPPQLKSRFNLKTDFFQDYRSFADQETWLKAIAANNTLARLASMGASLEGRQLWVVQLSNDFTNTARKSIWINGGQHAREWLSPAACLFLIQYALRNPQATLSKYNLLIAPNINPDGYEYSRLTNRYWRKNKRANKDGTVGVDLNRNWDFKWNQINGGGSTGSEVYPGLAPASEPEVRFTSDYILANKSKIAAGIDVHTYGEMVLRNYGWTMTPSRDEQKLKRIGDAMARAAQQVAREPYKSDRSAGLYPTSGSLDDWFYEKAGFPGFTFEMRDSGSHGFVCPPSYIIPNGNELVQAILALIGQL